MKACYSCSDRPIRNGIYKSVMEKFIKDQLPKTNKHYHKKGSPSKLMSGLKPDTCIFYFGAKNRPITSPIQSFKDAYGNLTNSGCTRTDKKGNREARKAAEGMPKVQIYEAGRRASVP